MTGEISFEEKKDEILRVLSESPSSLTARQIKRLVEGLPRTRRIDAHDYSFPLRQLEELGLIKKTRTSWRTRWVIVKGGQEHRV